MGVAGVSNVLLWPVSLVYKFCIWSWKTDVFKGLWNFSCIVWSLGFNLQNFVRLHLTVGIHLDKVVDFSNQISSRLSEHLLLSLPAASHLPASPSRKANCLLLLGVTETSVSCSGAGVQAPRRPAPAGWFTETLRTMAVLGPIKTSKGGDYGEGMAQPFPREFLCTLERIWVSQDGRTSCKLQLSGLQSVGFPRQGWKGLGGGRFDREVVQHWRGPSSRRKHDVCLPGAQRLV